MASPSQPSETVTARSRQNNVQQVGITRHQSFQSAPAGDRVPNPPGGESGTSHARPRGPAQPTQGGKTAKETHRVYGGSLSENEHLQSNTSAWYAKIGLMCPRHSRHRFLCDFPSGIQRRPGNPGQLSSSPLLLVIKRILLAVEIMRSVIRPLNSSPLGGKEQGAHRLPVVTQSRHIQTRSIASRV